MKLRRADLEREYAALLERIGALRAYLYGESIRDVDMDEVERLEMQHRGMQQYAAALAQRIAAHGDHC